MKPKKKAILIVDDDPGVCRLVALLLKKDYDVRTAESGEEALDLLRRRKPDLVLLDILMPGMGGIEVLEEALKLAPSLRVVMLTGVMNIDVVRQALGLGAKGYITKPFTGEAVKSAVALQLQRRRPPSL